MQQPRCVEDVVASLLCEWHMGCDLYTIYEQMRVAGQDLELEKGEQNIYDTILRKSPISFSVTVENL